ncbi:MAG: MerR family transcriptional regulator [Kibdelosporangium sp.]
MRMAELSRRAGVPVPTIKYYLREGLLPPGERTSPNQAFYDEQHVRRLKMVRAMIEVGGMSIAGVRDVLDTIDAPELPPFEVLGQVQHRLEPAYPEGEGAYWETAREQVEALVARRGWPAKPGNPTSRTLIAALASLYELGREDLVGLLDRYADASEIVAEVDLEKVARGRDMDDLIEGVVIGTVVGEKMFGALRRLAHQHATAQRFGVVPAERADSGEGE